MADGQTIRLFAALLPPAVCARELRAWARGALGAPGVRLLAPESMHITIAFLGERPATELPALVAAIEAAELPPPQLALGAPILLPARRPRTVAVEITNGGGELAELQLQTVRALADASGWEPPRRRFRPHITVARFRAGTPSPGALPVTPAISFRPVALELLRSHLLPTGAEYEPLASRPLQAAEPDP